jgi:hypothetical protein
VVVAVPAVRVMQVPAHEVVDMVAVGDLLVAAAGAMNVPGLMLAAGMVGRAIRRVGSAHLDDVLVDVIAVGMMQMSVVEVVEVVSMLERCVPATGAMLVLVP